MKGVKLKITMNVERVEAFVRIPPQDDVEAAIASVRAVFGEDKVEVLGGGIPLAGQAKKVSIVPQVKTPGPEGTAGYDLQNYVLCSPPHMAERLVDIPLDELREWYQLDRETIQARDQGAIREYLRSKDGSA